MKKKRPDPPKNPPTNTLGYELVAMMLYLGGRANTPQEATAITEEFMAAEIAESGDLKTDVEAELTWFAVRLFS